MILDIVVFFTSLEMVLELGQLVVATARTRAMKCPQCQNDHSRVVDSRDSGDRRPAQAAVFGVLRKVHDL